MSHLKIMYSLYQNLTDIEEIKFMILL